MSVSIDHMLLNKHIARIVKKAVELLAIYAAEKDFVDYFQQNSFKLFIQVCIPYLRISSNQRMLIEEDCKEFVNEQDDICGDQKSGTPRTAVAKLLGELVDNVEGFIQFVFNFCLDAINRCL